MNDNHLKLMAKAMAYLHLADTMAAREERLRQALFATEAKRREFQGEATRAIREAWDLAMAPASGAERKRPVCAGGHGAALTLFALASVALRWLMAHGQ